MGVSMLSKIMLTLFLLGISGCGGKGFFEINKRVMYCDLKIWTRPVFRCVQGTYFKCNDGVEYCVTSYTRLSKMSMEDK